MRDWSGFSFSRPDRMRETPHLGWLFTRFSTHAAAEGRDLRGRKVSGILALCLTALGIAGMSGCGSVTVQRGSTTTGSGTAATLHGIQCTNTSVVGAASDTCSVSLTSPATGAGVAITLSSSNPAVAVPASVTVPAGGTSVGFTITIPAVTTAQSTTINATVGSVAANVVIQMSPSAPLLTVNATTVNFGNVTVSTTSTQSVTLSSTGSQPVTVSAVSVTGANFTVSGATFPVTLSPGQSATISIAFTPPASGTSTGQITITSNSASNPTDSLSLTGTGVVAAHWVALNWNAPTSSPVAVTGYNVYRASSGSTAYQLLNTGLDTQTTYVDYAVLSGSAYAYIVRSVDAQGVESAPSNTTTATIP